MAPEKIVVHTAEGRDLTISLNTKTNYVQVVKSSLDKVEKDAYVGAATKSIGLSQVALEVVVFPAAMKGANEGHYPWDQLPDTTLPDKANIASSMTNGTVATVSSPSTRMVKSTMTNGTVPTTTDQKDAKKLTITYKGGEQTIIVPPTAPVVTLRAGAEIDLTTGASVFIVATMDGDVGTASFVAVGIDGVKPPM